MRLGMGLAKKEHGAAYLRRQAKERGMTLVEIMVVVVIVSLLAGIGGVAVFNVLFRANNDVAWVQLGKIQTSLDMYRTATGQYPTTSQGLEQLARSNAGQKPVMTSIPSDPWGNAYIYVSPGRQNPDGVDLMSYGADGAPGNGDDVCGWLPKDEQPCG